MVFPRLLLSRRTHILATSITALLASSFVSSPLHAANTWDGGGSNANWSTALNWDNNLVPAFPQPLTFAGSTNLSATNDLTGITVQGITFSAGAGAFTLGGNGIVLGGANALITNGITNSSSSLQTINLPLTLAPGNHTFTGGTGGLVMNGGLSHNAGGIALFTPGAGITLKGTPLVNGILGGWATISGNWATLDATNQVVPYTGYITIASDNLTIASNPASNVQITNATTGNITLAAAGTTDINTLLLTDTVRRDVIIGGGNTLRLGAQGGIYRSDTTGTGTSNTTMAIGGAVNEGTVTAGGADNVAGELVINSGSNSPNNGAINILATITDNGTGAVTVVKTGFGPTSLQGNNTYTGGTYVSEGRLQATNVSSFGTGPVTVVGTGQAFLPGGVIANDYFISGIGTSEASGHGAIRLGTNTNLTGTITLIGNARIAHRGSGATFGSGGSISGKITGAFDLEIGGHSATNSQGTVTLINSANDYTGNTIIREWQRLSLGANEVIPNGPGKGNVVLNASGTAARFVVFNLNGFNETINGLSRAGNATNNNVFVQNDAASTVATLTLGDNNTTATFNGVIRDFGQTTDGGTGSGGTLALTKIGTGTQILSGTNTYSGDTNIDGGTLSITGSLLGTGTLNVNASATGAGTLSGTGSVGNVILGANSGTNITRLAPGDTSSVGTTGTLTLASLRVNGGDLVFDLGAVSDQITVLGNTTFAAPATITPAAVAPNGTYTLLTSTGGLTLTTPPTVNAPANTRKTFTLDTSVPNTLNLVVGGTSKTLTWTGTASSTWDVNASTNWTDGNIAEKFFLGDSVVFGNGPANRTINITTTVQPGAITVDNSTGNDYTFSGTGAIAGSGMLTKAGTGVLTISSNNSYTGGTTISAGTLQVGDGGSLGSGLLTNDATLIFNRTDSATVANEITGSGELRKTGTGVLTLSGVNSYAGATRISNGTVRVTNAANGNSSLGSLFSGDVTIAAGATLDLSGNLTAQALNFGTKQFNIEGTGVDGTGAIVNHGVSQFNALQRVTLTNDTTIGGTQRFDIRGSGALLNLDNHTLTKNGTNQFSLVSTTVNDGNIVVNQGIFSIETSTSIPDFGTGKTITFNSGSTGQFYSNTTTPSAVTRPIVVNGSVQFGSASNSNNSIIGSNITLNGDLTVTNLNNTNNTSTLTLTGNISENGGARSITKNGPSILVLTGNNAYSGGTTINGGRLQVGDGGTSGSIGAGPVINNALFAFERSDAVNFPNSISGTGALQKDGAGVLTLSGNSSYAGDTTINDGSLIVSGSLSGTSNLNVSFGTLQLGAPNRLSDTATLTLGVGTFDSNGFSETLGALALTGTGRLELGLGSSVLHFADSALATWFGTLSITNWSGSVSGGGTDQIFFGSNNSSLTSEQLGLISFVDPFGPGSGNFGARLLPSGEIVAVPEPSTVATLLGGLGSLLLCGRWSRRNRRVHTSTLE